MQVVLELNVQNILYKWYGKFNKGSKIVNSQTKADGKAL